MPRPRCCRRIACQPDAKVFKPRGIPMDELECEVMGLDELEAVRLADLEGMYQEDAARKMGISRSTLARLVESGRRKLVGAVVGGKALRIEDAPEGKTVEK